MKGAPSLFTGVTNPSSATGAVACRELKLVIAFSGDAEIRRIPASYCGFLVFHFATSCPLIIQFGDVSWAKKEAHSVLVFFLEVLRNPCAKHKRECAMGAHL